MTAVVFACLWWLVKWGAVTVVVLVALLVEVGCCAGDFSVKGKVGHGQAVSVSGSHWQPGAFIAIRICTIASA